MAQDQSDQDPQPVGTITDYKPGTSPYDPNPAAPQPVGTIQDFPSSGGPFLNESQAAQGALTTLNAAQDARRKEATARDQYTQRNQEPGIPLDIDTGLDAATRAKISFEQNIDKRVQMLANEPGILGARKTVDGQNIIARVAGDDGKPKDILVNERGQNFKDLADLAGSAPKAAVAAGLAAATGGGSLLAQGAVMGAGNLATGLVQDASTRALSQRPLDVGESLKRNAAESAIQAAVPVALGKAAQVVGGIKAPFASGVTDLERTATTAAERQAVPLMPSQLTGSKALARLETWSENLPLGGPLTAERQAQQTAMRAAGQRALGANTPTQVASDEDVANAVKKFADTQAGAGDANAQAAALNAKTAANKALQDSLSQGIAPTNVPQTQAGALIRGKVNDLRDQFLTAAQQNYGNTYQLANQEGVFFDPSAVTKLANQVKSENPQVFQQLVPEINRIQGLNQAMTQATPEAQAAAEAAGTEAGPPQIPLDQAVRLRALVNDKINRGEAVGDIPGAYLKKLAGALTEGIDGSVAKGSPELQKAYADASSAYKEGITKFNQSDVSKLFARPDEPGYVADNEIIPKLFSGKGNLDAVRAVGQILGPQSPEYRTFLRSGVNSMMNESDTGNGLIDAGSLLNRIKGMDPELRQEVFGPSMDGIVNNAKLLDAAQGGKIDGADLQRVMQGAPKDAAGALQTAMDVQSQHDNAYYQAIKKLVGSGSLTPDGVNSEEFVSRFIDKAEPSEIRQAMTQIRAQDPNLAEQIRQNALLQTLRKAGTGGFQESPYVGAGGRLPGGYDYSKLLEQTTGPQRDKLQTVVGKEGLQFLDDMRDIAATTEKRKVFGGAAASLKYNNILGNFMEMREGALGEVKNVLLNRVLATVLSAPGGKAYLSQQVPLFGAMPLTRAATFAAPSIVGPLASEETAKPPGRGPLARQQQPEPEPATP